MEGVDGKIEENLVRNVPGNYCSSLTLTSYYSTEKQLQIQAVLPLTLIPIRIDLDIQPFRPEAPLPTPPNAHDFGIDENLPAYRAPDVTPAYRLKDAFLWNLHEALTTPDYFAKTLVDELDLPADKKQVFIRDITSQIRQQLEEYAGVALHPLFQSTAQGQQPQGSAAPAVQPAVSRDQSSTPAPTTSVATPAATSGPVAVNGDANGTADGITASASLSEDAHNPDDAYRCIINLNINLMSRLYTDKFEWSLLHPPGFAEAFSKQTCADLGLPPEWVPAMSHAIYEAVLRLKKEVCENGGLVNYGDLDNDAAEGVEAGWRYEPERLAADWEPTLENLSREEIEKREGDRERQLRRVRRETARFSSTSNMPQNDFFANPEAVDQPMGRGERSKKKRRFRSLSPLGRDTPDIAGYGGGGGLND
jgi:chromatin structure-remodeling complex subunit SFH1